MTTPNDYAKLATQCAQLAQQVRPPSDEDQYAQARKLIVYHLNSAASKAREIAEALAKEPSK